MISLFFLQLSYGYFAIFLSPILSLLIFSFMYAINAATVQRSEAQLKPRQRQTEMVTPLASTPPSTFAPSSSAGGVTLEAIMT